MKITLLLLACLASTAHGSWFKKEWDKVFHHHHHSSSHHSGGVLHKIIEGIGHDIKVVEHGVEHVVEDLEKGMEKIGADVEKHLPDWEAAFDKFSKDVKTGFKEVVHVLLNLQPELLKLNDKIFGARFGLIMDRLETAGIEAIPGVGEAFKIIVDGDDVYHSFKGAAACFKSKDWACVGKDLASALSSVSDAVELRAGDVSSLVKSLCKDAKIALKAGTIAADVVKDWSKFEQLFKYAKAKDWTDFASTLGQILSDVEQFLTFADDNSKGVFQKIVSDLQKGVDIVQRGDELLIDGIDIGADVKKAEADWASKDYAAVGADLSDIVTLIANGATAVSSRMDKIAAELAKVAGGVAKAGTVASALVSDYKSLQTVFNDVETTGKVSQEDLSALSAVLEDVASQMQSIETSKKSRWNAAIAALKKDLDVLDDSTKVLSDIKQAATDWKARDYAAVGSDLAAAVDAIADAVAEIDPNMTTVVSELEKAAGVIEKAGATGADLLADYKTLKSTFAEISSSGKVTQTDLAEISSVLEDVAAQLPATAAGTWGRVVAVLKSSLSLLDSADKVSSEIMQAAADWKSKDYAGVGRDIAAALNAVAAEIAAIDPKMSKVVTELQKAAGIATATGTVAAETASDYLQLAAVFKSIESSGGKVTAAEVQTIGTVLKDITNQLTQASASLRGDWLKACEALEKATADLSKADTIAVAGFNVVGDVQAAEACFKSLDFSCIGKKLSDIVKTISGLLKKSDDGQVREG